MKSTFKTEYLELQIFLFILKNLDAFLATEQSVVGLPPLSKANNTATLRFADQMLLSDGGIDSTVF